ncbi:hypothetical protein DRW03_29850 [Corallococcus sp. H22C18031201]|nr:hypothetical protein DRW03_29850 [Corallococcus sp. H22C18031201]
MRLHLELKRRKARGQSLVLSCLSFLIMALMTTLSFNLSHALREKVSLQQHSDSLAYSMAVMEARALNYYAASNRAIAASYVAMTSMHAYVSTASLTSDMLSAAKNNFYVIAALEFVQCACWTCFMHCVHGFKAISIAGKYGNKSRSYGNKVKNLDKDMVKVVDNLDRMIDMIHVSQDAVHLKTAQTVLDGSSNGLKDLTDYNVPGATTIPTAVGGLNANEFNCAVDGLPCPGGESSTSRQAASKTMTEVANATRPTWPSTRATGALAMVLPMVVLHPSFLQELMSDIPGDGVHFAIPWLSRGASSVTDSTGKWNTTQSGSEGKMVVSREDRGAMFDQWKHGVGPYWAFNAEVYSNSSNGGHSPSNAHSGSHKFEGVSAKALTSCIGSGNCFMKFRGSSDEKKDYGQPRVYSYVTKKMRVGDVSKADWEINSAATIKFKHGAQGTGELVLAADEGAALSKALVYYHRFGDNGWREAPTLFNPYWRAKLHPFRDGQEAAKVLGLAGNKDGAMIANVPGVSL